MMAKTFFLVKNVWDGGIIVLLKIISLMILVAIWSL
jgi:hypothetical protein